MLEDQWGVPLWWEWLTERCGAGAQQMAAEPKPKALSGWPKEGFETQQARTVTKTPSGSFVFDGPSWASLAIEEPDSSS